MQDVRGNRALRGEMIFIIVATAILCYFSHDHCPNRIGLYELAQLMISQQIGAVTYT